MTAYSNKRCKQNTTRIKRTNERMSAPYTIIAMTMYNDDDDSDADDKNKRNAHTPKSE